MEDPQLQELIGNWLPSKQKFYRNFALEVLKDSVKTEKGWVSN